MLSMTEILLNLKQVRLSFALEPRVLRIDTSKEGPVTAADIIEDGGSGAKPGNTSRP